MNTLIAMGFLISTILIWAGNNKDVKKRTIEKIKERAKEENRYDLMLLDGCVNEEVNKLLSKLSFRGVILFFISFSALLYKLIS